MTKKPTPKRAPTKKAATQSKKSKLDPGLLEAHYAYEAAINSNNTDLVMAMYDKDAEILQPDGPIVTGHNAIRKWVDGYFKEFKTRWKKVPTKNFVLGEYGFDEGRDTAVDTPRKGGPSIHYDCKGILVYKRQKDGEWRIFRDIWNNNKAPRTGK
jgi:ketosteroid isomerase-like protein